MFGFETITEYEDTIPPLHRQFMERAEVNRLARQGHFYEEQQENEKSPLEKRAQSRDSNTASDIIKNSDRL